MRTLRAALIGALVVPSAVALAPVASAGMTIGHYNLNIRGAVRLSHMDLDDCLVQSPRRGQPVCGGIGHPDADRQGI